MTNDTPTQTLFPRGASHVRSIDTLARPISYAGAAVPAEILHEVRMKLVALIGL
jgi:mRNA interferase MazF